MCGAIGLRAADPSASGSGAWVRRGPGRSPHGRRGFVDFTCRGVSESVASVGGILGGRELEEFRRYENELRSERKKVGTRQSTRCDKLLVTT